MARPSISRRMTFNRTSMESKPCLPSLNTSIRNLLIEPVWNRNKFSDHSSTQLRQLLIEPVWNRNVLSAKFPVRLVTAFNRTSMESKHRILWHPNILSESFNRTSMESKQYPIKCCLLLYSMLLIEPVWNRNDGKSYV